MNIHYGCEACATLVVCPRHGVTPDGYDLVDSLARARPVYSRTERRVLDAGGITDPSSYDIGEGQ